jgi:adenosine/AMP kinase
VGRTAAAAAAAAARRMELKLVKIEKPDDMNFILGQSHFIKTVEDLHEGAQSFLVNSLTLTNR